MIINGADLFDAWPIINMKRTKETEHGVSYGLSEAGYDIRIKQSVRFRHVDGKPVVEILHPGKQEYDMEPGRFILASSIEEFDMPPDLVGVVHDKSTWARRSLSVFNTVIEPKWRGFLTLELVYHGYEELVIPAGSGIAQVLFHRLSRNATYNGKYQDQEDAPVQPRKSK